MNSNMVKSEKFGDLHLAYHFTVPLTVINFCGKFWVVVGGFG